MTKEEYTCLFQNIGAAALALNMENSHSGNISMLATVPGCAEPALYITKTGSKLGHLQDRDVCAPGLDKITCGVFQASSETNIHRGILKNANAGLPTGQAGAAMHAHVLTAILISYNIESIKPIDRLGAYHLAEVPSVRFEFPVGSQEMVDKIPPLLKDHKIMIVKTHGAFGRGASLKEVFYNMALLEYSAKVIFYATTLGVDIKRIQSQLPAGLKAMYPFAPPDYSETLDSRCDADDQGIRRQFEETCQDIFYLELSPFHTGSASVRDGQTMLYAPKASTPKGLPGPILRIAIAPEAKIDPGLILDAHEVETHRHLYAHSRVNAVLHTLSPQATAQAFYAIDRGADRIIPADAEGGYLYPAIPVLDSHPALDALTAKVVKYKMAAVKGEGIWSGGNTLGYTLHHPSSAKNISYLRNYLNIMHRLGMGPDVKSQENEKGREW